MTDLGRATHMLGIDIKHDLNNGTIKLGQEIFTVSELKCFNIDACNPLHTPGIVKELATAPHGCTLR